MKMIEARAVTDKLVSVKIEHVVRVHFLKEGNQFTIHVPGPLTPTQVAQVVSAGRPFVTGLGDDGQLVISDAPPV